ncbi:hypothetical protein NUW54_g11201 [Trametes sanguinea]|uniref:Uncharacterized protein n=1 Tax=Trametes sanguinea TaxID=158606 RepID=A0ACC1NJ03_9APHY|nr:hypothetical protein NUW54_g11201 [Trametes sanguinea]
MASGLSKDEQETLRLLVQHVSRAFYEPKYTVVMDQLVRHPVLKDDDLAGRMGLQLKELNKIMATLEGHKLVRMYVQVELYHRNTHPNLFKPPDYIAKNEP